LFRSVRELLFNVVKHSKVKNARITMDRMPGGMVRIVVSDKGVGFDPREREAREGSSGGFGLFKLRARLELLGGGMKIQSTPGQGCQMTLWAPERVGPKTGVVSLPPLEDSTPKSNGRDEAKLPARRPQIKEQGKIRIVVADDHAVVRDGLVRAFADEPDFDVVGEATDGIEAVQFARELQPDFILMDVNMPRMDGIKATATIHAESPSVKILGLSMYNDEGHRNAMLEAGALDLLRKSNSAAHVISALRQHAGKP
jgi:CheY-like chemotaxis protein